MQTLFQVLVVLLVSMAVGSVLSWRAARRQSTEPEPQRDLDAILQRFSDRVGARARPTEVERVGAGPWLARPIGPEDASGGPTFPAGAALPASVEVHLAEGAWPLFVWDGDERRPFAVVRVPPAHGQPLPVHLELGLRGLTCGSGSVEVEGLGPVPVHVR